MNGELAHERQSQYPVNNSFPKKNVHELQNVCMINYVLQRNEKRMICRKKGKSQLVYRPDEKQNVNMEKRGKMRADPESFRF